MGIAWSAAAALVCLLGGRQEAPAPRGARSRWVWPTASFLVLALFFAPDFHIAQFTLEGFALPYPVNSATPLLRLQSPERPSTSAIPLLPIAGLPAASAPIDVVGLPPPSPALGQGGVIRTPGGLALRLPATSTALVGFAAEDAGDYALANVYPLTGGERIVICPGSHGGCAERVLDVTRKGSSFVAGWSRAPSVHVGPCDVSSLTRWRFPKVDSPRPRAVALLDLYHYDTARCAPTAADANEGFWPRQDPAGGLLMPLRSFLIVSDGQPYLALLDGPESVRLEGAAAGRGGHLQAPGAGPHTLQVLEPRYEIASKPECKDDGRVCKRILVYFRVHQVRLQLGSDRAYLVPVSPPVISVDPVCPDGRRCGTDGLVATWTKDASAASTTGGSALSFPFALVQGQPMQATFSLSQDALDCGVSPVPCVLTRTRDGIFSSARGVVTAVGPVGREQVLLRTTLLERPYWIMALVIGLLLWASSANPPPSRVAAVVVAVACVLLAARALFGFKILARFPHDPEGLGTALAGVATLPTALLFADARLTPAALRWPAIVLAANAAVLAVLTRVTATVTFGDQPAQTLLMCAAVIAGAAACALWGRPMWNALLSPRGHRAVLAVLVTIGIIRLASALADRERIGLPLILLVWPAVVALLPAWLARSDRPLLSALIAALAIFFVQWPLHGDLGAALVSGPPLAAAAIWTWAYAIPVTRRRLVMAAAAVAVLGAGMWWWHRSVDGVYPPVAVDERWVARPATNALCPDEDDLGSASAKLELTGYEPAFARSNVEQRRDDFLVRGAANRSGTRVGAEVHEFMSVLRRYAAGTPGAGLWGAGFMTAEVRRYGISEVEAQLSDGSPSTLVASEGGPAATLGLLVLHAAILAAMVRWHASLQPRRSPAGAALAFGALAAVSIPAWATLLMIGGNFGVLPFTGQSTPLLAPLSGTDLVLAPLLWGIALVLTRLASEEPAHAG